MDAADSDKDHCCYGQYTARMSDNSHGCSCGEHNQSDVTEMMEFCNCRSCREHGKRRTLATDLSSCIHGDSTTQSNLQTCAMDYESRYHQLKMEKDDMERNYSRECQERETAERKYRQELEEKSFIEDKFYSLNETLQRYDDDLNSLRKENHFLKDQFDRMKNAINSRSTENAIGQEFASLSSVPLSEPVDADAYKQEVAVLASENDILRQIIEIINQQSQEKASWDERLSEKQMLEQKSWQTDPEVIRLQEETSKLKSRIRELERSQRERESEMEEVALDLEDKTRKAKKDISRLEEEVHSKSLVVENLERQLYQLKMEYHEEVQKWELKLEAEALMKTQVQEEANVLQGTIQNLETERIEMITKLEELYSSENAIIQARSDLEARFSVEIGELQAQMEEEIRSKVELSQEMTILMNEFVNLRNKSKQMEEMYLSEIEALRFNNGMEIKGVTAQNDSNAYVATGKRSFQSDGRNARNDIQSQLDQEIQKRQALEKENKELLYKMKNLFSNSDQLSGDKNKQETSVSSYSGGDLNEADESSVHFKKKIRALENKVAELTEECETLDKSVKKRREVEKKNRELLSELDDLSAQRDELLRKQRTLVYEVEKSSSSLHDTMDKNRRLIDEIDSKSRKIRDMEDNFRQERNSLLRNYDRERSSEMRDIERKKDDLEKRLCDLARENGRLENIVRDLEEEIQHLRQSSGQIRLGNTTSLNNAVDGSRKWTGVSNPGSQKTTNSIGLEQEALDLEQLLQERQRMEEEHLKVLDEQKKQMREEFELEKQNLRQYFEDEKRSLANRFSVGSDLGSHAMQGNVLVPGNASVPGNAPVLQGNATVPSSVPMPGINTQTGQARHPIPLNPGNVFPVQGPVPSQAMFNNQQHSSSDTYQPVQNPCEEIPTNYQAPRHPSQFHVSFKTPQCIPQQQFTYPSQYSSQVAQNIVHSQGIRQESQVDNNLVELQQEFQRLKAEKQNMEKRLNNMERRMTGTSNDARVRNKSAVFISAGNMGESSYENEKEYSPVNKQETSRSSALPLSYSSVSNIDGQLQVTMKKLVEEHRQHSDELRKQIMLQKESFEREKTKMHREYSALLNNVKCLKNEVHMLKHEKESLREKLNRERKDSHMREERSRDELTTVRQEYELKVRQEIEKSERTVRELQRKLSLSDKSLKGIEMKFRDEVTQIEKKFSRQRMNLEAKMRESENLIRSNIEIHYQAKLNSEKERYETTLKELRQEIKCLQAQRREIQLKISKDVSDTTRVNMQKDPSYSVEVQNKDLYKCVEKEIETRFTLEKRRLQDTLIDLRKEVEELKKEKNDIKSCYREEKQKREEQFEREKRRLEERHRYDTDELKKKIDILEDENIKLITMQGGISINGHQKTTTSPHTTIMHKRNTSLELKNNELEKDIIYLKGRLSDLESRQSRLLLSHNDKPSTASAAERKVRFNPVNGSSAQLRRALSSTNLRSMSGAGYQAICSGRPVISHDDLGISSHGTAALSSGLFTGSRAIGKSGIPGNSYAGSTEIVHIPSIGILNGAVGQSLASGRDTNISNVGRSSSGLLSGSQGGTGASSAIAGNYSRHISGGSFLSGDAATTGRFPSGYNTGIGSASYLSSGGPGGGALTDSALGTGLSSGQSGFIGGTIVGADSGSGHASSAYLSGNRNSESISRFSSSAAHRDGLRSGCFGTSALESSFGSGGNNIGMQSSFTSGQRIVTRQAMSGSLGDGKSTSYAANTGMSCANCSARGGV